MVGEFGEVLVMDWGLAKILECSSRGKDAPTASRASPADLPGKNRFTSTATGNDLVGNHSASPTDAERKNALRRLAAGGNGNPGMTLEGDIMGTPQYMSPETGRRPHRGLGRTAQTSFHWAASSTAFSPCARRSREKPATKFCKRLPAAASRH